MTLLSTPHAAPGVPGALIDAPALPRRQRDGIRPPKFADKFAALDFEALPLPVISMFEPPEDVPLAQLQLMVRGEDLRRRLVPWTALDALPRVELAAPLVCQIFNWYEHVVWGGVVLADALDTLELGVSCGGYYAFRSGDGQYFETLSDDEARDPRVLLATHLNGQPLPHEYGGPVRLVVPFLQGYKSVKWVTGIEAYPRDPVGIKRLLAQSKSAHLGQAWRDRLGIVPPEGRPGDPLP